MGVLHLKEDSKKESIVANYLMVLLFTIIFLIYAFPFVSYINDFLPHRMSPPLKDISEFDMIILLKILGIMIGRAVLTILTLCGVFYGITLFIEKKKKNSL